MHPARGGATSTAHHWLGRRRVRVRPPQEAGQRGGDGAQSTSRGGVGEAGLSARRHAKSGRAFMPARSGAEQTRWPRWRPIGRPHAAAGGWKRPSAPRPAGPSGPARSGAPNDDAAGGWQRGQRRTPRRSFFHCSPVCSWACYFFMKKLYRPVVQFGEHLTIVSSALGPSQGGSTPGGLGPNARTTSIGYPLNTAQERHAQPPAGSQEMYLQKREVTRSVVGGCPKPTLSRYDASISCAARCFPGHPACPTAAEHVPRRRLRS